MPVITSADNYSNPIGYQAGITALSFTFHNKMKLCGSHERAADLF